MFKHDFTAIIDNDDEDYCCYLWKLLSLFFCVANDLLVEDCRREPKKLEEDLSFYIV